VLFRRRAFIETGTKQGIAWALLTREENVKFVKNNVVVFFFTFKHENLF